MDVSAPLPRADVARLLMQALADYGFSKTAAALEAESGVHLELPAAKDLSAAVLAGEWERVLALLVPPSPLALPQEAQALVLQQLYLEQALHSPLTALVTLRTRLAPLLPPSELHRLSSLLAAPDVPALLRVAQWAPPPASRTDLLSRLRALLPPGVLLPPRRLDAIASHAWQWQRQGCAYHQGSSSAFSLLSDHVCRPLVLPRSPFAVFEAHADEVWCLAFARTHPWLASGARNGGIVLWRWAEKAPSSSARLLAGHSQAVSALAWAPNDTMLASASLDGSVRLWDANEKHAHTMNNHANGTGGAVPMSDNNSNDASGNCCLAVLNGHTDGVVAIAWMPDGRHLVSTAHDRLILLWDTHTQQIVHRITCRVRLNDFAISPSAERLIAICQEKRIRFFPLPPLPLSASSIWPAEAEALSIQETDALTSLSLSMDGKWLLVSTAGGGAPAVHLWNLEKRTLVRKFTGHKQGRFVVRACFAGADESLVLSGSEDSLVYVWQRSQGVLLAALPAHAGTVNAVAAAPSSDLVFASASDDHTLLLWKADS